MKTNLRALARDAAAALLPLALISTAFAQTPVTPNVPLTAQEKANQKVVTDMWREVIMAQNPAAIAKFYAPDVVQHDPIVPGGLKGFQEFFGRIWKSPPKPAPPEISPPPAVLMTKGDLTLVVFARPRKDPDDGSKTYTSYWFELFRLKDGKVVEHWDQALKGDQMPQ